MRYFEDFQVGEKIVTRRRTITETDIVMFAAFSADWYPLHVDAIYAKDSPFGERIAHGFLVISVAAGLAPMYDIAIVAFSGIDKVRFLAPVKIGDTIQISMETGALLIKDYYNPNLREVPHRSKPRIQGG